MTTRIKTIAALALASAALVPAPSLAQGFGGGGDPGMAAMMGIMGALVGGIGGGQRPAYGGGYPSYGGGYGYQGNQVGYGYGYGGGGYGGYGCRVVVQRGYDAWGNPAATRRRICG